QFTPNPGKPSFQRTEVKTIYDNSAVYVAAMMYDTSPDSILHELSQRDNMPNADRFILLLDTYNDDINAFEFGVTAAGVQVDGKQSSDGEDLTWNAVWQSSVKITDKGWTAELKIPYS